MEGLVDPLAREFWTGLGGFQQCTTEFIRVTNVLLPDHVFLREYPELLTGSRTASGTPVAAQLLGGDPVCLAENAHRVVELGACAVDLNFGCPAPTVNRHDGGAALLQFPHRIQGIVEAVRKAVPTTVPVTAKLRLGFMDTDLCFENTAAAAAGGAQRLTIHCRTKADMYKPPAKWEWIARIRENLHAQGLHPEIFSNGEIWTLEDFERCHAISQADGYVLGRGLMADPLLAWRIQGRRVNAGWSELTELFPPYFELCFERAGESYAVKRMKQLLRLMAQRWPEAATYFETIKTHSQPQQMREMWA